MSNQAVTGHSMGGHGALSLHFKYPGKYRSVSAFAPICNPMESQWGKKAFEGYFGSVEAGAGHDATNLVKTYTGPKVPILYEQPTDDKWKREGQLHPENFKLACASVNYPLILRYQPGYDHSYFMISTFMKDHIQFHATNMGLVPRS